MPAKAKAPEGWDETEYEFAHDGSPTKDGHDWWCNACEFRCQSLDEAADHVAASRDMNIPHYMWERNRPPADGVVPKGAKRRIVLVGGAVAPQVKRRTKK
jgi:hypothetical protein